ncbi:MAG TPA: alpha/beta hydrolase [Bacteroidia bacterium]|nr:alpha/beta hydrolase [Bacteroidia bacterium]
MMNAFLAKHLPIVFLTALLFSCGQDKPNPQKEDSTSNLLSDEHSNFDELKIEKVFLDKDTTKSCYTIIFPSKLPIKGYIFLLPGFSETAERVMQQSSLPLQLAESGLLTIIPTLQDGIFSFGIDDSSQQSFKNIIADVREKNNLTDQPFYLGGYSIGGSCVLKYAEEADKKPNAVFAIDPPIDFEQVYNSCKRNLRLSVNTQPNEESVFLVQKISEIMNGTPENSIANYHTISPYSFSDTSQTAIKKLLETPLRIYTEPDIHWWMKERSMDYTSMNSTFHSAMINELNRLGNKNAVLITTENKGYREPDQTRHPHSWSIVDNNELIQWLLLHE